MDASTIYFQEEIDIEIGGKEVRIEISATEAGNIETEVIDSPQYSVSFEFSENIENLTGTTINGDEVELKNVIAAIGLQVDNSEGSYQFVSDVPAVSEVKIDGTDGYVSYEGEQVSVKFDILGLKHFIPHNAVDSITLIERDGWRAEASPVDNLDERIEYIKSHKILVRTAEVVITIDEPGCISHQLSQSREKLEDLLTLSGFVQGVGPSFVRAELVSISDESVEDVNNGLRYTQLWSTQGDIGGAFNTNRLVWGNEFTRYLDTAYDNYDYHVKEEIRFRYALGYYWDALNSTRPVEGRYLSVCSAIELLAKRYSDLYKQQSGTQDKIEFLIDELGIETEDLADFAGTSDRAVSSKYFYSYSRQYVVHGDNNPRWDELRDDFEAALRLLQRILRNQLVGSLEDGSEYNELTEITPNEFVEFE